MTFFVNQKLMPAVTSTEDRILDAAMEMFIRFGFRRTTMGDIAGKAEMSRPALYLVYRNKEEIFCASVRRYSGQLEELAAERIAEKGNLSGKIEAALKTWVVGPYKMISRSPEANELHEIAFSFGEEIRKHMHACFENQLLEVMEASGEVNERSLEEVGTDRAAIAALMVRTAPQLKRVVESCEELEQHLATLLRVNVAVLTG